MENKTGKVGIREYVAIIMLMLGPRLSDDTPALFYDKLYNAAWMAPIISACFAAIPIFVLFKVHSLYQDKNLHDINIKLFGKHIGVMLSVLLWLIGGYAIAVDTRSYVDIIGTMYFTKTPTVMIYIVLMVVCAYGAKRGIQNIGSVSYMLIFYVKITLFTALMLTLQESHFTAIFPIWGPGIKEIIKESAFRSSMYADFLYLFLILPYLTSFKDFKKGTWFSFAFVAFELSISFMFFILMFDYVTVSNINYPFHETIRYISLGQFLTNIETFFFPLWLVATFIRFSVYLYLNAILFGSIFKVSSFEYVIPALATIVLLLGMIPEAPATNTYVFRNNFQQWLSPFFMGFPFLLWAAAMVKGEFKHADKKSL